MCELCDPIERKTKWYWPLDEEYLDKTNWRILDCDKCKVPMIVYKEHDKLPTMDELMFVLLQAYSLGITGRIRMEQSKIKDHFHFHVMSEK